MPKGVSASVKLPQISMPQVTNSNFVTSGEGILFTVVSTPGCGRGCPKNATRFLMVMAN